MEFTFELDEVELSKTERQQMIFITGKVATWQTGDVAKSAACATEVIFLSASRDVFLAANRKLWSLSAEFKETVEQIEMAPAKQRKQNGDVIVYRWRRTVAIAISFSKG